MIDSRRFTYFLAVVDCEGLGKAAASVGLSQSTLSAAIRGLETELGLPLFHRVGRVLRLTAAGEDLVPVARRAVAAMSTAEASARAIKAGHLGMTTIAATASTSYYPLSDIIGVAVGRHPALSVRVVNVETQRDAAQLLLTGKVELALIPGPIDLPGLLSHKVATAEFHLAVPPAMFTDREFVTLADLDGLPMMGRQEGSLTWAQLGLARHTSSVPQVIVSDPPAVAIPRLVGLGVGAAFVPATSRYLFEGEGARLLPIDPPFVFDVLLAHRDGPLSPASHAVVVSAGQG